MKNDPDYSALRPKTLDAKWLDPECWDGCQSLLLKAKVQRYEKLLRRILEWCETDTPNFEIDADAIRNALNFVTHPPLLPALEARRMRITVSKTPRGNCRVQKPKGCQMSRSQPVRRAYCRKCQQKYFKESCGGHPRHFNVVALAWVRSGEAVLMECGTCGRSYISYSRAATAAAQTALGPFAKCNP